MKIICDFRENKSEIPNLLKSMNAEIEIKTLEDGDYLLPNNVICTRKTIADFFNSRNSGHMSDEIFRLLNKYPDSIIFLLVEKNTYNTRDELLVANKSIKSMQFILPTIKTSNQRDTAETLIYYAKKAENNELQYFKRRIVLQDNTNPVIALYMGFDGVGQKTAEKIFAKYPKPIDLFLAIKETGIYNKELWDKKSYWCSVRWDAGIDGIGEKTFQKVSNLLLKGLINN